MKSSNIIKLVNGAKGITFLRENLQDVLEFVSLYRENPETIIKYNEYSNTFVFGRTSTYINEGDCIVFVPIGNKLILTKNPNWISEFEEKFKW